MTTQYITVEIGTQSCARGRVFNGRGLVCGYNGRWLDRRDDGHINNNHIFGEFGFSCTPFAQSVTRVFIHNRPKTAHHVNRMEKTYGTSEQQWNIIDAKRHKSPRNEQREYLTQ